MTTIREILAVVVTADTKGAVKEIENVGVAAKKELAGTAGTASKNLSANLVKGGAAAVGFGAVVTAGLIHAAHGYEEAERASLKLDNTIANEPRLAGASRAAFDDLASSISATTRVRKTDAVAAEALLGQFNLTQQQIKELLPLVVDLSVKTGLDLDTAVRKVGKSIETQKNGLKSQGVEMDATALKADAFSAVMNGLRGTVGGFAEQEGKTFSGRLAIMHNQLDEIKANVGQGVTEAYSKLLTPVVAVSEAIANSSEATQRNVGTVLALGSVAVTAAGGIATLAGGLVDAREALIAFGLAEKGVAAGAVTIAAPVAAVALVVAAAASAYADLTQHSRDAAKAQKAVFEILQSGKSKTEAATTVLEDYVGKHSEYFAVLHKLGVSEKDYLAAIQGKPEAIAKVNAAIDKFAAANEAGSFAARDLRHELDIETGGLKDGAKAAADADAAHRALASATDNSAQRAEDAARRWRKFAREVVDADDALIAFYEHELDRHDATRAFASAQRDVTLSVLDAKDAQEAYDKAVREHGASSEEAIRADLARQAAASGVTEAYDDQIRKALDLAASQSGYKIGSENSGQATQNFVNKLIGLANTLAPDSALRKELEAYIGALHRVPTDIVTTFRTVGGAAGSVTGAGGHRTFAAGGDPNVGERVLVGEHGKELAEFKGANPARDVRKVMPAAASSDDLVWVGVQGPELVQFTAPAHVYPHGQGPDPTRQVRRFAAGGDPEKDEIAWVGEHGKELAHLNPTARTTTALRDPGVPGRVTSSAVAISHPGVARVAAHGGPILRVPGPVREAARLAVQQQRTPTVRAGSASQPALVVNGPLMSNNFDGSAPARAELDVAAREVNWRLGNRVALAGRR